MRWRLVAAVCVMALLLPARIITAAVAAIPEGRTSGDIIQSACGWHTDNVECLGSVPLGSLPGRIDLPEGAALHEDYLYVASKSSLRIFEVSQPARPRLLSYEVFSSAGFTAAARAQNYNNFGPATNGEILLLPVEDAENYPTVVIDVRDKTDPRAIATVETNNQEVKWECLLDCRWAYGGTTGRILDLRDPSAPRRLESLWHDDLRFDNPRFLGRISTLNAWAVSEVRPGVVVTGSVPMYVLDARRDPRNPRVLMSSDGAPWSYGGARWPAKGSARHIISFSYVPGLSPDCRVRMVDPPDERAESGLATWETGPRARHGLVHVADVYQLDNGTYQDGDPPVSGECGVMDFDPHPAYRRTGLVALAASFHGVKFLRVDRNGQIHEVGHFLPQGGATDDGRWIDEDTFYTIDVFGPDQSVAAGRMHILRFKEGLW